MHSKALQELIETCPQVVLAFQARRDLEALETDARALWAVRVLDAWAHKHLGFWKLRAGCNADQSPRSIVWIEREATDDDDGSIGYLDGEEGEEMFYQDFDAPTPDAARIAAAEALVAADPLLAPDPSPSMRQQLGRAKREGQTAAPPHSYAIGAGGGDDGCSACGAGPHDPCDRGVDHSV